MKKTIHFFGMMLMAAVVAFSLVACGSDNNDAPANPNDGTPPPADGTTLTINGSSFVVDRAYWTSAVLNETQNWYTIYLSNADVNNPTVNPWHCITLTFHTDSGNLNVLPQGTFDIKGMSATIIGTNQDVAYYAVSGQVTIAGNSLSIPALEYTLDPNGEGTRYRGTAIGFSGTFTKIAGRN